MFGRTSLAIAIAIAASSAAAAAARSLAPHCSWCFVWEHGVGRDPLGAHSLRLSHGCLWSLPRSAMTMCGSAIGPSLFESGGGPHSLPLARLPLPVVPEAAVAVMALLSVYDRLGRLLTEWLLTAYLVGLSRLRPC